MRFRFLFLSILLAMVALFAFAGESGKLGVTVLDETGSPFPGVVVTLASTKNLAPPQSLTTNVEGKAVFGVVQPGSGYKLTIEVAGYSKIEEPNIIVGINKEQNLLFKLTPQKTEKVVVTGKKDVASIDAPTGQVTISGEFFEDLPILGRNYQSALTLAPGVNDSDGDGNPNVHGARARDFKANLDGISNVDPLTGTFMSNINPDAIEEIEVVTTGADASYGRAVGGFANIITKQGSNDFEGVFKMYWRSSKLDGNGASPLPAKLFEYKWYQPSFSVTGKIIRDRLFYALNHEYHDIGVPIPLVGGGSVVVKYNQWRHLDKVTWQVSPRNKLNFQYSADPYNIGPLGIDSRTSPASGFDYKQGGPTYSVEWQNPISPSFTVKSVVGFSDTGISRLPVTKGVKNSCVVDIYADDNFTPRTSPLRRIGQPIDQDYCFSFDNSTQSGSYFLDTADKRQRLTLKSDATLYLNSFLGKEHTFDFGVIAEKEHYDNDAFWYPSSLFSTDPSQLGFDNDGTLSSGMTTGTMFRTTFQPGSPDTKHRESDGLTIGAYVTDTFRPHPNVSVKVGLRLERENVSADGKEPLDPDRELFFFNRAFNICPGHDDPHQSGTCTRIVISNFTAYEGFPDICKSEFGTVSGFCRLVSDANDVPLRKDSKIDITNYNLGPRLSVQWDPKGNGKMKVFGTYGKIYDKIFLAVPVVEQGPESFDLFYTANQVSVPTPQNPNNQEFLVGATPSGASGATVSQLSRNLRTPFVKELTLGFSREIAPETLLTLTYIKRNYEDYLQDVDINHYGEDLGDNRLPCKLIPGDIPVFAAQGKPDGKFDDCQGFFPGVPDGVPDLKIKNPFFNQIFQVGNYNSTQYKAYELELVRRLHHNWQLEGSYVWSKAIGQAEDYLSQLGDDPTSTQDEKGYLNYDQRHIVKVNAVTHLPFWGLRLGTVTRWESGRPFSLVRVTPSQDTLQRFGAFPIGYTQIRTIFPTGQRNDKRNESYYTIDVNLQRDFQAGKANFTVGAEILNLLNDDRLFIARIRNGAPARNEDFEPSERRFGREFQISLKANF